MDKVQDFMKQTLLLLLVALVIVGCKSTKQAGDLDAEQARDLHAFARSKKVDLGETIEPICAGSTNALAQVLQFSSNFTSLDGKARAYQKFLFGVYRTLQNMGANGRFVRVLAAQEPEVQQRVRDFVFDSLVHDRPGSRGSYRESWSVDGAIPDIPAPLKGRFWTEAEIRQDFKGVFPPDYQFGHDNPIFAHGG
jgi:hypothetical protein